MAWRRKMKNTKLASLCCASFFACASVAAQDNGDQLLKNCADDSPQLLMCLGYVNGVYDSLILSGVRMRQRTMCPGQAKVSRGQMRDIVVRHLQANPEARQQPAVVPTATALERALPCPPPDAPPAPGQRQ